MSVDRELVLLTGSTNRPLAEEIGNILQLEPHYPISRFSNGETRVITPFARGREVVIIQPTYPDIDRSYMELFIIADAVKRAHAAKIIAVEPYFGFGRQDCKDQPHTAVSAKLMANLIVASGINHLVTIDMHSSQQDGFFDIDYDNLQASICFIPYLKRLNRTNQKFVSPDIGGGKRARAFNRRLDGCGVIIGDKEREYEKHNQSSTSSLIGDEIAGYHAVIIDDQIDTAGSIRDTAILLDKGRALSIIAVSTHGVLSGPALERIADSPIDRVLITNSILQPDKVLSDPKFEILSVAPLLSEAIRRIHCNQSIGEVLLD